MKKWYLLTSVMLFSCFVAGQTEKELKKAEKNLARRAREKSLIIAPSLAYQSVRDRANSPLWYSGLAAGQYLTYHSVEAIAQRSVGIGALQGKLLSSLNGKGTDEMTRVDVFMRELYRGTDWNLGKCRYYVGYRAGILVNSRNNNQLSNAAFTYEAGFDIGPAGKIQRDFSFGKKLDKNGAPRKRIITAAYEVALPVYSYSIRPSYIVIDDFTDGESGNINDFSRYHSRSFGSFFRVLSNVMMEYHLHNTNSVYLTYTWDFYRFSQPNTVTTGTHLLQFGFKFRLNTNI